MNFIIDECLHTSLADTANRRGHVAQHVAWLGLSGSSDWDLMKRINQEDAVFVTNNRQDFRRLFEREEIHGGLVVFVPNVPPATQRVLFERVLDELDAEPDLINQALEVSLDGNDIVIERYELPG